MFDKEAIEALHLGISEAIGAASTALLDEGGAPNLAALPNNFTVHDLEKYLPSRRRARGVMTTQVVNDFAHYVTSHKEPGASVFINIDEMKAVAVLNLGTPEAPGHADNTAVYHAKQTAAYKAMLAVANGSPASQVKVAEFLEDWSNSVLCQHEGQMINTAAAIAAVRDITIDSLRKLGSTEGQLSATRTAFEEVKASSKEQIPTLITFECEPYAGFPSRAFNIRLSINTGGDKPTLVLRVVKQEEHQEQMGRDLVDLIDPAIRTIAGVNEVPVLLGTYGAKA